MALLNKHDTREEFCGVMKDHRFHIYKLDTCADVDADNRETEHVRLEYVRCGGPLTIDIPREAPKKPDYANCGKRFFEHEPHKWATLKDPEILREPDEAYGSTHVNVEWFMCDGQGTGFSSLFETMGQTAEDTARAFYDFSDLGGFEPYNPLKFKQRPW